MTDSVAISAGRDGVLDELRRKPEVSVLIVGAGVNGTGLFRELALQGVDVLLVDRWDFCSGASAAPSRMIHGGLRYLEFGEFRLVHEAVVERNRLLINAPHYVGPMPTTIPLFCRLSGALTAIRRFLHLGGSNRPAHRGSIMVKIGLKLYDMYTGRHRVMPKHHFVSRAEALARRPALNPETLCTATYYDAKITYPERLCVELILDAEAACDRARALNYVSLQGASGGGVVLRDELTGQDLHVRPQLLVNAAGPWIDLVNGCLDHETKLIGGTKGGHLVLDNAELLAALDGDLVYYETPDGRTSIAMPWLGKALIGTTDIRIKDPDDARCDEDEADYILASIREVFPGLTVGREDIVSRFSGVRPLRYSGDIATNQASRDHYCDVIEPTDGVTLPVYSMVGGKWTSFRAFSEQVADRLLARLGRQRQVETQDLPIGGGKDFPRDDEARARWLADLHDRTGLDEDRLETLLGRYGTRGADVAAFCTAEQDAPLKYHETYTAREIEFIIRNERVMHLDDLILRRTAIALLGQMSAELLDELLAIAARVCNWTADATAEERTRTIDLLLDRHAIDLS